MERRKAIALATAVTCVLGSTTVAFASVGGGSLLGFGGAKDTGIGSVSAAQLAADNSANVVRRTKNVYDKVVVGASDRSSTRAAMLSRAQTVASPPPNDMPQAPVLTPDTGATRRRDTSDDTGEIRRTPTRAPSVTNDPPEREPEPTSTTTSTINAPVTTTTRPRGVPEDWPPDKPIPPMPPNCHQPQLEDNGVWNCQDD